MSNESRRTATSEILDVDSYALRDGGRAFFLTVKEEVVTLQEAVTGIDLSDALAVGGSRKTRLGSEPLEPLWLKGGPRPLVAREGDLLLELELGAVLNPGLFLDQRRNRAVLREKLQSTISALGGRPLRLLNLFCYTGAFSLAVARECVDAGAAVELINVDLSKRYLSWLKRNVALNFPGTDAVVSREFPQDARKFLETEVRKRPASYDAIVIDPPTFSRGPTPFRVENELPGMVTTAIKLLRGAPGDLLFVSCNDSRWLTSAFEATLSEAAPGFRLTPGSYSLEEFGPDYLLKSAFLTRA
ncbi:MAG: class I SAM-dependent methyltransferase [Bdellovibrionales bacterium]|nr:class I SAM-dependent methyltransferase [Bdellovibrionales bacterium]